MIRQPATGCGGVTLCISSSAWGISGWLLRGAGQSPEFADRCLDIATRTTSRKYEVRGKRLGEIALAQRQWEETEAWLRQALLLARTVGNPPQLWKTYVAMGHLFRR